MTEPASGGLFAVTAAGVSVFGMATGIHPMLLVAGVIGGWWAMSYQKSMKPPLRVTAATISAFSAAWFAPVIAQVSIAFARSHLPWWPDTVTVDLAQFPLAVAFGLLAWVVIGRRVISFFDKKAQEFEK